MRYILSGALALALCNGAQAQETTTYSYDPVGSLKTATVSGGTNNGVTQTFTYDAAQNRTNATVSGVPVVNPPCSFAVLDGSGSDEFNFNLQVQRTGACTGPVQISYTTTYSANSSGVLNFATTDSVKYISFPSNCCSTTTYTYNVHIALASGSAAISDADAVATQFGSL